MTVKLSLLQCCCADRGLLRLRLSSNGVVGSYLWAKDLNFRARNAGLKPAPWLHPAAKRCLSFNFSVPVSCLICFIWLERETGIEPATSSLGKRWKIVSQGLWRFLRRIEATVFTEFPHFDREWSHNGVTKNNFKE